MFSCLTEIFILFLESTKLLQPAFKAFQNITQSEQIAKFACLPSEGKKETGSY